MIGHDLRPRHLPASLNAEQKSRFGAGASPPQPGNHRRADLRPHG
jgi:hypothetical protein